MQLFLLCAIAVPQLEAGVTITGGKTGSPDVPNFFNLLQKENYNLHSFVPDLSFFKNLTKNFIKNEYYVYNDRENWLQLVGFGNQILEKLE